MSVVITGPSPNKTKLYLVKYLTLSVCFNHNSITNCTPKITPKEIKQIISDLITNQLTNEPKLYAVK